MSDSRLQRLERAWEASGSVEDRAALLHERLRAGGLSERGLHLLAYVGDPGAAQLFPGDANDVSSLLEENVLPWAERDPRDEVVGVLRETLEHMRSQLVDLAAGVLAGEGYECEGVSARRPHAEALERLEREGVHAPLVLAEWYPLVGPVSFVGYAYHWEDTSERIHTLVNADPFEVKWTAGSALDWNEEWIDPEVGFKIPFAPDPGHKANYSSSGAYHVVGGAVPCLDARVYDDDSGFKGTLLQHVRSAIAGRGFLALPKDFELRSPGD